MDVGSRIRLATFNGDSKSPDDCVQSENYWLLIGKTGIIVKSENNNSRVLVQFDEQVSSLDLHCHNKISNSLLIKITDLEAI